MAVCLFVCLLTGLRNTTGWVIMKKNQKMVFGPTLIPFNFESDLDYRLDKKSIFSHLYIIMCLGGGMHSLSTLVSLNGYK